MLIELTSGAEATGASYAEFKRLESEFALSLGVLLEEMVLPSDDAEVFKLFLIWFVTTRQRALSLESVWRAAGAVMERTRGTGGNLTRRADVKACFTNGYTPGYYNQILSITQ